MLGTLDFRGLEILGAQLLFLEHGLGNAMETINYMGLDLPKMNELLHSVLIHVYLNNTIL